MAATVFENYSKSLLPRLHLLQRVSKFSMTVSPPFDHGLMWSICSSTDESLAGEPYIYQFTDEEDVLHYWIIGKNGPELEPYGFAEYLHPSESEWTAGYVARTNGNTAPWLDKAKEELGFDF